MQGQDAFHAQHVVQLVLRHFPVPLRLLALGALTLGGSTLPGYFVLAKGPLASWCAAFDVVCTPFESRVVSRMK